MLQHMKWESVSCYKSQLFTAVYRKTGARVVKTSQKQLFRSWQGEEVKERPRHKRAYYVTGQSNLLYITWPEARFPLKASFDTKMVNFTSMEWQKSEPVIRSYFMKKNQNIFTAKRIVMELCLLLLQPFLRSWLHSFKGVLNETASELIWFLPCFINGNLTHQTENNQPPIYYQDTVKR